MKMGWGRRSRVFWTFGTAGLVLAVLLVVNLLQGSFAIPAEQVGAAIRAGWRSPAVGCPHEAWLVVWQLRMPMVVAMVVAGLALGVAGAVMQGFLRNPLVDPGLLGVSSGASLAVVGLQLFASLWVSRWIWLLPLGAFVGSIVVVMVLYALTETLSRGQTLGLILAGVALNALLGAVGLLLLTLANNHVLRDVFLWGLGDASTLTWVLLAWGSGFVGLGLMLLWGQASALNVLSLGEHNAALSGVNLPRLRLLCMTGVALAVGASVALVGPIAFVGLMVPHVMRGALGPNHRWLVPASGLGGAVLLLLAHWLGFVLVAPRVIPLGVLAALLGAPFFLILLWRLRACRPQ